MMKRILSTLLLLVCLPVKAELTIEITQGIASSIPISVVPFKTPAGMPEDIEGIVRNDLERSGHFAVLSPDDMLSHPKSEEDLYFRDWRLLKQDYVVIGSISQLPEGLYQVRYQLFDIFNEREILVQTLKGTEAQLRDIAHRLSDAVYEQLTGIRGAFLRSWLMSQPIQSVPSLI